MALVDIDIHILSELAVLQQQIREAQLDFKIEWDEVIAVKHQCDMLCQLNGASPEIRKLSDRMGRAIKILNTKMIFMDDIGSRERALTQHLVSYIKAVDTGKGKESHE